MSHITLYEIIKNNVNKEIITSVLSSMASSYINTFSISNDIKKLLSNQNQTLFNSSSVNNIYFMIVHIIIVQILNKISSYYLYKSSTDFDLSIIKYIFLKSINYNKLRNIKRSEIINNIKQLLKIKKLIEYTSTTIISTIISLLNVIKPLLYQIHQVSLLIIFISLVIYLYKNRIKGINLISSDSLKIMNDIKLLLKNNNTANSKEILSYLDTLKDDLEKEYKMEYDKNISIKNLITQLTIIFSIFLLGPLYYMYKKNELTLGEFISNIYNILMFIKSMDILSIKFKSIIEDYNSIQKAIQFFNTCLKTELITISFLDLNTIQIKNLIFQNISINDIEITFSNNKSFIILIQGNHNSGKSILLKSLAGHLDYQGKILFNNINIKDTNYLNHIFFIEQEPIVNKNKSIFENIIGYFENTKELNNYIEFLINQLELNNILTDIYSKKNFISNIQKQSIYLIKSLIINKKIILVDGNNIDTNIIIKYISICNNLKKIVILSNLNKLNNNLFDKIIYL